MGIEGEPIDRPTFARLAAAAASAPRPMPIPKAFAAARFEKAIPNF